MTTQKQPTETKRPTCFVIMPISDVETYSPGHFTRVYQHLIVPACEKAGFAPLLASDVKETNMIVIDILQRLYSAEMVLCDLSARNPNVLFELGFRQAFNKPVTLIKDHRTERIFDISGLRDILYDETLRVDTAQATISEIADRLDATSKATETRAGGVNSLVQLLNVEAAVIPERSQLSGETQIVLDAVRDLSDRVRALEPTRVRGSVVRNSGIRAVRQFHVTVQGSGEAVAELELLLRARWDITGVEMSNVEGLIVISGFVGAEIAHEEFEHAVLTFAAEIGTIRIMEQRWSSGLKGGAFR